MKKIALIGLLLVSNLLCQEIGKDKNQLITAAASGDLKKVQELIAAGADVNKPFVGSLGPEEEPEIFDWPLRAAVRGGNLEIVKLLLKNRAELNRKVMGGRTIMHEAALYNRSDIVPILAEAGEKLDVVGKIGSSPLSDAASADNFEALKALLKAGANPKINEVLSNVVVRRPGPYAEKNLKAIKELIKAGAPIDANAVNYAAEAGRDDLINLYIKEGADVKNSAALHYAVGLLKEDFKNFNDYYKKVVKSLLDAGADVNRQLTKSDWIVQTVPRLEGVTALESAVNANNIDGVRMLLKNGADPSISDKFGSKPLDTAKRRGFTEIIKMLEDAAKKENK